MDKITELDNKYIVVKREDVLLLNPQDQIIFEEYLKQIQIHRCKKSGKSITVYGSALNEYVVLNLDDEISLAHLNRKLTELIHKRMLSKAFDEPCLLEDPKVRDIAVDLVNAILRTKQE